MIFLSLFGASVGIMVLLSRMANRPVLQLKIIHHVSTEFKVMARTTDWFMNNPRIILRNLQSLQHKGYHVGSLQADKKYEPYAFRYAQWVSLGSVKTEKSLEEFRRDCKASDVYAEFYAEYNTMAMRKEVTTRQTRYWHRNIKPELEPVSEPKLK